MKVTKVLLIVSIGVLATAFAGVLRSDQEPVHENETKFELNINPDENYLTGLEKLKDALSQWSDPQPQDLKDIDVDELYEFLPVGSSYAGQEHKISEFDLGYDAGDATGPPPDVEDPNEPSAATLPSIISSKIWILYAIVLAIMSYKSF